MAGPSNRGFPIVVQKLAPFLPNFCFTRTLLPVTRDESGVRGQNFARAGAEVSSTTYRDTEPPAYNLHASPQPRARRTHPTRNIPNGPTKRLESRNKAFPLDNMGSPPHVKLESLCAASRCRNLRRSSRLKPRPFSTNCSLSPRSLLLRSNHVRAAGHVGCARRGARA